MVNPYAAMRMQSIFNPLKPTPTYPSKRQLDINTPLQDEEDDQEEPGGDYFSEMMKLTRPGPQMTAYQQALQNVPKPEDYEPTKMGRWAAALSGFGAGVRNPAEGYSTARSIIGEPYESAVKDYQVGLGAKGAGAQLERQTALDQLKSMSEARALGLRYDEYRRRLAADKANQQFRQGTLAASNERNRLTGIGLQNTAAYRQGQLTQQQKNTQSLITYRQITGQAAQKRANAAAARVDYLNKRGEKPPSQTQQAYLIQNVYQGMRMDPTWREFITNPDPSDKNYFQPDPSMRDRNPRMWENFQAELKKRVENAMKGGSPFFEPDLDDDEPDSDEDDLGYDIIDDTGRRR